MSVVTNLIISTCGTEDGDLIAGWLQSHYGGILASDIHANDETSDEWIVGGTRCLEANIRVAAYNYLDLDELLSAMLIMDFTDREMVQLFVQGQEEDCFTEYFQSRLSK